jgi:hypothetical protein
VMVPGTGDCAAAGRIRAGESAVTPTAMEPYKKTRRFIETLLALAVLGKSMPCSSQAHHRRRSVPKASHLTRKSVLSERTTLQIPEGGKRAIAMGPGDAEGDE